MVKLKRLAFILVIVLSFYAGLVLTTYQHELAHANYARELGAKNIEIKMEPHGLQGTTYVYDIPEDSKQAWIAGTGAIESEYPLTSIPALLLAILTAVVFLGLTFLSKR